MDPAYLLDTAILVHLIRGDATGLRIRADYAPLMMEPRPAISIVTEGEIRSLAYQWKWGREKRAQMAFLIDYFDRYTIDAPDILEAYAVIDAHSLATGRAMGENDVWIAATAHVTGRVLLTMDQDFDHLHPAFLTRELVAGGQ